MQAQAADSLRGAKQSGVLPRVAGGVLLHLALGDAEKTDLDAAGRWYQATVAALAHHRWSHCGRHRIAEGALRAIVGCAAGVADVVAVNIRARTYVGVEVARDVLRRNGQREGDQ